MAVWTKLRIVPNALTTGIAHPAVVEMEAFLEMETLWEQKFAHKIKAKSIRRAKREQDARHIPTVLVAFEGAWCSISTTGTSFGSFGWMLVTYEPA